MVDAAMLGVRRGTLSAGPSCPEAKDDLPPTCLVFLNVVDLEGGALVDVVSDRDRPAEVRSEENCWVWVGISDGDGGGANPSDIPNCSMSKSFSSLDPE